MQIIKRMIAILASVVLVYLFFGISLFLSSWIVILLFIVLLYALSHLMWIYAPVKLKEMFDSNKKRFIKIVFFLLIFMLYGGKAINHFCLPGIFHPISLIGDLGIILFTLFMGWVLVRKKEKKLAFIFKGLAVFIPLILFSAISTNNSTVIIESADTLRSLPYAAWTSIEGSNRKTGVTKNAYPSRYKGFNLYCDSTSPKAYLVNMSGERVHAWSGGSDAWWHVEMLDNGDLLGITRGGMLIKQDWNSNIKWRKKGRFTFHHDIEVAENGDVYTLGRKEDMVLESGLPTPFFNDYIVILSENGKIKRKISLFKMLKEEIPPQIISDIYRGWRNRLNSLRGFQDTLEIVSEKLIHDVQAVLLNEYFHTNTIEILDKDIEGFCKKGDILICSRNFNIVAILDPKKEKVTWKWGRGVLDYPHHPTLLKNGNILIFDNGNKRGYSRIIELNPFKKEIVWEYSKKSDNMFFSDWGGSSQKLLNGNILIADSNKGHVFEITPRGRVVWEFYNPVINKEDKKRATIYRMVRITDAKKYRFINGDKK